MLSCINVTTFTCGNNYLSVQLSVNLYFKQTIKCKHFAFNLIKFIKITGCTKPPVRLFTFTDYEIITVRSFLLFTLQVCSI